MTIKRILAALLFVAASAAASRAEIFDAVNIPDQERFTLSFTYKDIDLNKPPEKPFVMRYHAAEASKKSVYLTRMVGDGPNRHAEVEITSTVHNGYTKKQLFKFLPGPKLVLASWEQSVFTPGGKKVRSEFYDLTESNPPLPKNLTHPFTLPLVLRGLDFKPGTERGFYIWFNPTMVFLAKLVVKGEEDVSVPAGKFRCHRLEIGPDLVDFAGPVVGRLLKPVIAPYIAWLDTKPPHRIVRYQGPFGMVNVAGPSEIYELSKIGD